MTKLEDIDKDSLNMNIAEWFGWSELGKVPMGNGRYVAMGESPRGHFIEVPDYTSDDTLALLIAKKLKTDKGYGVILEIGECDVAICRLHGTEDSDWYEGSGKTLAEAICLAWLRESLDEGVYHDGQ